VEPPVSYLKYTAFITVCKMAIVFGSLDCVYFVCRVLSLRSYLFGPTSSTASPFFFHFLYPATVIARKRITADELKARPKANSYQRGAYGEGGLEGRNKHVDMVKQDQNTALNHTLHPIPQHSTRNAEKKGFMCTRTHLRARSAPKWNHRT
jgi:hypothetical protein